MFLQSCRSCLNCSLSLYASAIPVLGKYLVIIFTLLVTLTAKPDFVGLILTQNKYRTMCTIVRFVRSLGVIYI